MTILDSDIFAGAGGGGGMAKLYKTGITAKQGDVIKSGITFSDYVRYTSSPEILTLSADPHLLESDFMINDSSTQIGSVSTFLDNASNADVWLKKGGQLWLRSGNYVLTDQLSHQVPDNLKIYGDYWTNYVTSTASVGLAGTIAVVTSDDQGNWMCINTAGLIFVSTNDAVTWTQLTFSTSSNAKIACNKAGRWWVCNSSGQVYVSDNLGANWTQQQTPVATSPTRLEYANNKLWFVPNADVNISPVSGNVTLAYSLPDTNSTSQAWTALTVAGTVGRNVIAADAWGRVLEIVGNKNGTIWFIGQYNQGAVFTYIYNESLNSWIFIIHSVSNAIVGAAYDPTLDSVWVGSFYYNSSGAQASVNGKDVCVSKTGVITNGVNSPFGASLLSTNVIRHRDDLCGYIRKNASVFAFCANQTGGNYQFGFTSRGVSSTASRAPVYDLGITTTATAGWRCCYESKGTIVMMGTYFARSRPCIGLPYVYSPVGGQVNYMRVK